jgi:hypothetical protein
MDEDMASDDGYDTSDGEWLSYAELATRRGIDRQSAFKLAARHRWRRQKGNTGQVRVFVPSAFAEPEDKSSDNGYDLSHHLAAFETALRTVREAHAGEAAALREHLERSEKRVEELLAGQELTVRMVADADARAQAAQQAVEEFRSLEEARKRRGRLARLRAAWRGE